MVSLRLIRDFFFYNCSEKFSLSVFISITRFTFFRIVKNRRILKFLVGKTLVEETSEELNLANLIFESDYDFPIGNRQFQARLSHSRVAL